jgi:hypothetical protein
MRIAQIALLRLCDFGGDLSRWSISEEEKMKKKY